MIRRMCLERARMPFLAKKLDTNSVAETGALSSWICHSQKTISPAFICKSHPISTLILFINGPTTWNEFRVYISKDDQHDWGWLRLRLPSLTSARAVSFTVMTSLVRLCRTRRPIKSLHIGFLALCEKSGYSLLLFLEWSFDFLWALH